MAEPDKSETPPSPWSSFFELVGGVVKKPAEYGLIGLAVVFTLWAAQNLSVLPKQFKGFGTEWTMPEKESRALNETAVIIAEIRNEIDKLKKDFSVVTSDLNQRQLTSVSAEAVLEVAEDKRGAETGVIVKKEQQEGEGYIWIGTFDPLWNGWKETTAGSLDGADLPWPEELKEGRILEITQNVNLREAQPDQKTYFQGIPVLGFVPVGEQITLAGPAIKYDRENGTQYWAKVTAVYTPN